MNDFRCTSFVLCLFPLLPVLFVSQQVPLKCGTIEQLLNAVCEENFIWNILKLFPFLFCNGCVCVYGWVWCVCDCAHVCVCVCVCLCLVYLKPRARHECHCTFLTSLTPHPSQRL